MKQERIAGFDLARAYAIFGMYIVNFNFCFGSFQNPSPMGKFLNLFIGNSTSIFIILAGMGVSFMVAASGDDMGARRRVKKVVIKRSWFLFALGILLYNWWPGDILHFYGGYMHIAALMLFVPRKYYLIAALLAILIYHALLWVLPVSTGWDSMTRYADFWTPLGFLRNTFYNGWNSIFPWVAYFMLGLWLGRLNWQMPWIRHRVFLAGLILFVLIKGLRLWIAYDFNHPDRTAFYSKAWNYITSEYFPPYLPYMLITTGFALMVIPVCFWVGQKFQSAKLVALLSQAGRMTLSLYVFHLTAGILLLAMLTGKNYGHYLEDETPTTALYISLYSAGFFVVSVLCCYLWGKRFAQGPLEMLMRKFSGK
jgi:uncharacterized protein